MVSSVILLKFSESRAKVFFFIGFLPNCSLSLLLLCRLLILSHYSHLRHSFQTQIILYYYFIKMIKRPPTAHTRTPKLFHYLMFVFSTVFVYFPPFCPMCFNLTTFLSVPSVSQFFSISVPPLPGMPCLTPNSACNGSSALRSQLKY